MLTMLQRSREADVNATERQKNQSALLWSRVRCI
nr:MAG TPA: hypothetical protein [Bacteriophage sp.]